MATSKEVAQNIMTLTQELNTELETWVSKGRKVAAKRARKLTLQLASEYKEFRHLSVAESKGSEEDTTE
jgi:Holliday junction resolvasome RuvABC DNA-binding subunit